MSVSLLSHISPLGPAFTRLAWLYNFRIVCVPDCVDIICTCGSLQLLMCGCACAWYVDILLCITYYMFVCKKILFLEFQRNLKVSVISPRNLLHFKAIFERVRVEL